MLRLNRKIILGIVGSSTVGFAYYLNTKSKRLNRVPLKNNDEKSLIKTIGKNVRDTFCIHAEVLSNNKIITNTNLRSSINFSEKYQYGKDTVYMSCKEYMTTDLSEGEKDMLDMTNKYEMIASQVFFRHGARTPLHKELPIGEYGYDRETLLKSVPHTEVPFFIRGLDGGPRPISQIEKRYASVKFQGGTHAGQLTHIGREQGYHLGLRLKKKYMKIWKLLPEDFLPEQIYLRSSNINRSLDTLQCVCAGLWGKNVEKPFEFLVASPNTEILYPAAHRCKSLRGIEKLAEIKFGEIDGYTEMSEILKKKLELEGSPWFFCYFDNVKCKMAHGLKVHDWLKNMSNDLGKMTAKVFVKLITVNEEHAVMGLKLGLGKVFATLLENFENPNKKLYMYSAHDSTLIPILLGFKSFDMNWPPFAADVSFDLLRDKETGNKIVCLSYCGKLIRRLPYDEFTDIINRYKITSEEHQNLCGDEALHKKLHGQIRKVKELRKIDDCITDEDFNHKRQLCQKKKEEEKKKLEAEEKLLQAMGMPTTPCFRAEGCGVPKL